MMDLTETEIERNGTRFIFEKMPVFPDGYRLSESVREMLADRIADADLSGGAMERGKALFQIVGTLSPDRVEGIRKRLFEHVTFSNSAARTPQKLAGAEETAFEGMKISDVYEIFARAFAVNFSDSFNDVLSRFDLAD